MSLPEYQRWKALAQVEPIGPHGDDLRLGVLISIVAGLFSDKPRGPADFLRWLRSKKPDAPRPETDEEIRASLAALALAWCE